MPIVIFPNPTLTKVTEKASKLLDKAKREIKKTTAPKIHDADQFTEQEPADFWTVRKRIPTDVLR